MLQNDLREQLIRQFPAEVVETADPAGGIIYACPTCKRPVTLNTDKCSGCGQVLSWDSINKQNAAKGIKVARLEFEVPMEFTKGDCRKCPLSYIAKSGNENVYECPLKMRATCKLEIL
ncbi:MAG: hypothetical protein ACI4AD_04885 [Roseburia sp.]